MTPPKTPLPQLQLNGPAYGWALAAATLLTTILVAHHPLPSGQGLSALAAMAGPAGWVHGLLMALAMLMAAGMSGFAWRLGISHPLVMGGWLSYVLGVAVELLAGLVSGFIVPDLAASGRASAPDLIAFAFLLNQALARLGLVMIGGGMVMWGHALLHHRGAARWIGILGLAAGGFTALFTLTLGHRIDVPALLAVVAAQAVWNLTVAGWLIYGVGLIDNQISRRDG